MRSAACTAGRSRSRAARCHTDHKGREMNIAPLDEKVLDHARTDFALRGAHAKVPCKSCHVPGKKHRDAPAGCVECHRADDKHRGSLGAACADCHGEANWKEARYDHARTRFALTGGARDAAVPRLPPRPDVQGGADDLRRLPPRGRQAAQGAARREVRCLPLHARLEGVELQPRPRHEVRAQGAASHREVRELSHRDAVARKAADGLQRVPPQGRQARWGRLGPSAQAVTPSATGARRRSITTRRSSRCSASTRTSSAATAIVT